MDALENVGIAFQQDVRLVYTTVLQVFSQRQISAAH